MKLSDFKQEEALDVLADIIEPLGMILTDQIVKAKIKEKNKPGAISAAIKNHKKEVIFILARLENKKPEEYSFTLATLPIIILQILNDAELLNFFNSALQDI